MKASCRRAGI